MCDFVDMPMPPKNYLDCGSNNLVVEETSYDIDQMVKEHQSLLSHMNAEQLKVYNMIID